MLRECCEFDIKRGSLTNCADNTDLTTHVLNDALANTETKSSTICIACLMLIQILEVHKQLLQPLLANTQASIYNFYHKSDTRYL